MSATAHIDTEKSHMDSATTCVTVEIVHTETATTHAAAAGAHVHPFDPALTAPKKVGAFLSKENSGRDNS